MRDTLETYERKEKDDADRKGIAVVDWIVGSFPEQGLPEGNAV
jgi:hypothetical protein